MESEIVSSFPSKIKASLGALVILALASAAASAQEPTPAALNYASQIFLDVGVKASLDQVVAGMASQLEHNVTATRPELRDALRETLIAIAPEFLKTEQGVLGDAAKFLASRMTEQELKETAAFFEGATGKKYVAAQGAAMADLAPSLRAWREQVSTDLLARTREEMKKKGYEF
jgi:hypothetical protein